MKEFYLLIGMFAVTFGVRYPVLAIVSKIQLSEIIIQALKYVPPAVLMAIIAPAILIPAGNGIELNFYNAPLIASIIAALVAWRTKNLLVTIITGMGILWVLRWLLSP